MRRSPFCQLAQPIWPGKAGPGNITMLTESVVIVRGPTLSSKRPRSDDAEILGFANLNPQTGSDDTTLIARIELTHFDDLIDVTGDHVVHAEAAVRACGDVARVVV